METYEIKGKNGFSRLMYFERRDDVTIITRDAVDHLEVVECSNQEALPELLRIIGQFVRDGFQVVRIN